MYLLTNIKEECVGCEACANACPRQCIHMKQDAEGFIYPFIKEDECIHCGICEKVCPIQKPKKEETEPVVYAVKHKDKGIQMESSSGGAFTAIAESVLRENGVVYASCFNTDKEVEINRIDKFSDLKKARKSKYVQSKMNKVHCSVIEDLRAGKTVLFVGTACQCDSIRCFLDVKKVDKSKFLLVDIICHGVASPKIWMEYLQQHEKMKKDKIVDIDFRDKSNGWAPMKMNITFQKSDNYKNYSRFDGYYRLFFGHYIIRPACHDCKYTTIHRKNDITIADFWGIKNISPELYDEYGVSMAMTNTEKGKLYIESIRSTAEVNRVNCDDISVYQPNLKRPTPPNRNRNKFWLLYAKSGFAKAFKKYGEFSTLDRFIDDVKNIIVRIVRK